MKKVNQKSFAPRLYRSAPRREVDGFVRYIIEFELDRGREISKAKARVHFEQLRQMSRPAEKENRPNDAIIDQDPLTGEWGGVETPYHRESYGMNRGKKDRSDTYAAKYGIIGEGGCSKAEFIAAIREVGHVSQSRAEQIFASCKRRGVARYHRETGLWYGCFVDEYPSLKTKPANVPRKNEYRERFGRMPALLHNWQNKEESELLAWLITEAAEQGESLTIDEADKLRHRIWNVTRENPVWISVGKDGPFHGIQGADYGLANGQTTEPQQRKAKVKPILDFDSDEGCFFIDGNRLSDFAMDKMETMPPKDPDEAEAYIMTVCGFSFDATRLVQEQSFERKSDNDVPPLFTRLPDGRYQGFFYKSPEQIAAEEERKKTEDREKAANGDANAQKRERVRYMPVIRSELDIYQWFMAVFEIEYHKAVSHFEKSLEKGLIVREYDQQHRSYFRGSENKTPVA